MKRTVFSLNTSASILIVFFMVGFSAVQNSSLQAQQVRFENLSLDDGLSQGSVNAIAQDESGFLWFATQEGVNRYDGYNFQVFRYRSGDTHSLPHNWVKDVVRGEHGALGLATLGGGFAYFDPRSESFIEFSSENSALPSSSVLSIAAAKDNTYWIGSYSGLQRLRVNPLLSDSLESEVELFTANADGLVSDTIYAMKLVGNHLWLATAKGLCALNTEKTEWQQLRTGKTPVHALFATDNSIVSVEAGELISRDSQTGSIRFQQTVPRALATKRVTAILKDSVNRLWLGSRNGLWLADNFSGAAGQPPLAFRLLTHNATDLSSLNDNAILSLFEDNSGIVWVGTRQGISKHSPSQRRFQCFNNSPGSSVQLSSELIFSICVDKTGTVWTGTGNGLNSAPGHANDLKFSKHTRGTISNSVVLSLLNDSHDRLWVGTNKGLKLLDSKRNEVQAFLHDSQDLNSIPHNTIFNLYEDKTQQIWAMTAGGSLCRFNEESGDFTRFSADSDLSSPPGNVIFSMISRQDGSLWAGTNVGIAKVNRNASLLTTPDELAKHDLLQQQTVFSMSEDAQQTVWLGTRNGLFGVTSAADSLIHLGFDDGLSNEVIYAILPDADDNLWLTTNRGLVCYSSQTGAFRTYFSEDGLQSNEFNQGAYFTAEDGTIYIGGIKGFNRFQPSELFHNDHQPDIVLTAFKKFDKAVSLEKPLNRLDELTLSYKDNFISLEFAALDFNNSSRNQYAYRLEGFDKDWIRCGSRRFASYTNLDGGDYLFRVKGSNNDGVWNEQGAQLKIVVVPPPWKTWWAYALYIAFVLGGFYLYTYLKTQAQRRELEQQQQVVTHLKKIDRLKDEFLANTSHELRTPLNGIIGITESLIAGAGGTLSDFQQKNLSLVVSSGRRLANLINDILDFSRLKKKEIGLKYSSVDLRELTQNVFAISEPLLADKPIVLSNEILPDTPTIFADENRLQQILQNLVGNAIKFTHVGKISVSVENSHDGLRVSIRDTGIGIPQDKLGTIFQSFEQADASTSREYGGTGLGLPITRQLVELHGGTIAAKSELGVGSVFTFFLPHEALPEGEKTDAGSLFVDESEIIEPAAALTDQNSYYPATSNTAKQETTTIDDPTPASNEGEGIHIMIVDDEPVNLQVLNNFLGLKGYTITQCDNGREALTKIYDDESVPDLILLDVMMPQLSGYDVCKKLREDYPAYQLPIVMLTAKTRTSDLIVGFEAGANDYVTKPFDQGELLSRVGTLLKLKKAVIDEKTLAGLHQELHVARRIQESILPSENPDIPGLDIASRYIPMDTVGGDFFDFHLTPDGQLGILVADVSGHGIPAAFISAMVKIAFSSQEEHAADSGQLLSHMNNMLCGKYEHNFVTASYTLIDLAKQKLLHADAGHLPLLVWRKKEQRLLSLKPEGLILGWDYTNDCPEEAMEIKSGDRIIIYTDGIIEAQNALGEFFETDAFPEVIQRYQDESASDFSEHLLQHVREWIGNEGSFADDLTLVVVDLQ